MTALIPPARKVGHLIVDISGFLKRPLCQLRHPVQLILRRQRHRLHARMLLDRVKFVKIVKWRPLFYHQRIDGDMLRFYLQHLP